MLHDKCNTTVCWPMDDVICGKAVVCVKKKLDCLVNLSEFQ